MYKELREQIERSSSRATHASEELTDLTEYTVSESPLELDTPERVEARLRILGLSERLSQEVAYSARPAEVATAIVRGGVLTPELTLGLERFIGPNDMLSVNFLERGARAALAVCKLNIGSGGSGTGSLVSPRLLITNNHVLPTSAEASESVAEFNFAHGPDGVQLQSEFFELDPDEFFVTSVELDYTLVAVRPIGASGRSLMDFGFNRLIARSGKALIGERVNIIQHPGGKLKQLALRENKILKLEHPQADSFIWYHTDTAPGSSGALVYNDQWEVVALHHSGEPKRNEAGELLALDGSIWNEEMGEDKIDWIANEGVRISRVAAELRESNFTGTKATLRDELLSGDGFSSERTANASLPAIGLQLPPDASTGLLQVNVNIQLGTLAPNAGQPQGQSETPTTTPRPTTSDTKLEQLLTEVKRNRSRTYYDADADQGMRDAYYESISAALEPDQLFLSLSTLLTNTHNSHLSYSPAKRLYPWVDLHKTESDLKLVSIYTGEVYSPEEFIEKDLAIERTIESRRLELMRNEALSPQRIEYELSELEASLPYNCEHVVPQSWFSKAEPMRGDLHHLFACQSGCNSFRSNIPYFDFTDFLEAIREKCGKRDGNRFEPEHGKGPVARATLYFLLRYPTVVNSNGVRYAMDDIDTLLQWHLSSEVQEYELHRNWAIHSAQGNRNPFIDFPEWGSQVDFSLGL